AISSTLPETTADTIIIIAVTEIKGTTLIPLLTITGIILLTINPSKIGIMITWIIDINIETGSTGNHCPAKSKSSKGVTMGASSVEKEVIVIDKGKFPLAK